MPPALKEVLLLGAFNPAAFYVGYLMGRQLGRRGDQQQKVVIAGLASGFAGLAFVGLLMAFGLIEARLNLLPGVLGVGIFVGAASAWLGYVVHSKGGGG